MKLFMQSLGCAKNQVDSEMLLGVLKENITLVAEPQEAELILLNTCAFIEPARKEAIDTIFELVEVKKQTKAKLVVCGCLPQRYKTEIVNLIPEVDRFITIDEYPNLANIINQVVKSDYQYQKKYDPLNRIYSTPNYMRYVKIAEGCMNRCAFCAIPLIRGNLKSRTIEDIVAEVKKEVREGAYELNLVAQDLSKYGFDLYHRHALVDLLRELIQIEGDFKIRLFYLYPELVSDELIELIKNSPKIMKYFDIPIQHCEDKLLKAMLRRSNKEMIVSLFHKIKREIPSAALRTTLMVGFPYEEETDVDALIEFIKDIRFDHMGAFTFSLEENTLACKYPNTISEETKQKRYERLMTVQAQIAYELKQAKIGSIIKDAFIIGYDEQSYMYVARSEEFAPDEIDGCIYIAAKEELTLGQRVDVRVLDADAYTLTGKQI
ncbi:MAG: 30S ribosomal protein S12 methylthiotransferase RimO [Roseburia sp.]|nr:30S ribosomal protein S12 methylthiotransferase RimO [Anaeroplasma bactoclasticum]MCM1196184.1 30S ribosomal protein S12 methylthiotransferase RimO [Roseburia sp.]